MRRRDFVKGIAGSAIGWPLAARAQQSTIPLIGFMHARSADDTVGQVSAFRHGLMEAGLVEGQDVKIEYRFAAGQYDQLPLMAADFVRQPVNLIVAASDPSAQAAKASTTTIPIVFAVGNDPIKLGLVESYNRPGGNATGINILTAAMEAKRLGLLHEVVPQAAIVGLIINPNYAQATAQVRQIEDAAHASGLQVYVLRVSNDEDVDTAFNAIVQQRIAALIVAADPFIDTRRDKIIGLSARHAVPTMYQFREHAVAGGLMSYGVDLIDVYRQVGIYAARVLKGAKPADLPVMEPTKFEFVINLKTARALGLKINPQLLTNADEVIE
jgi:putative tryptophan/tyrosine transport system substrate-binding protein